MTCDECQCLLDRAAFLFVVRSDGHSKAFGLCWMCCRLVLGNPARARIARRATFAGWQQLPLPLVSS